MKPVSDIQKLILEDVRSIEPESLATTVVSLMLPSAAIATGTVYALHAIADGLALARNRVGEPFTRDPAAWEQEVVKYVAALRAQFAGILLASTSSTPRNRCICRRR